MSVGSWRFFILVLLASAAWVGVRGEPVSTGDPSLVAAEVTLREPDQRPRPDLRSLAPKPELFLDGAFYQPDLSAGFGDPAVRQAELDRLRRLGGDTVWLQYVAHGDFSMLSPGPGRVDPVRAFLDEAAARDMKVWLGTREDPALWEKPEVPIGVWEEAGERSLEVAEEAVARYADHPALAGWYWTPELVWGAAPSWLRLERLARITRRQLAALRDLRPDIPVAIPIGPGGVVGSEIPTRGWCRWLEVVRPDAVVVMDGVGTAHVDISQADRVYAAARGCAERVGAQVVADVEVFGPGLPPAPERLALQFAAAWRHGDRVVAFDLPHHLAPHTVAHEVLSAAPAPELPVQTTPLPADWSGVALATVDLSFPLARAASVEVITRWPRPAGVSLAIERDGAWDVVGEMTPHHGPGRDEITWRWTAAGPVVTGAARVTLRRGDGDLQLVGARARGRPVAESTP